MLQSPLRVLLCTFGTLGEIQPAIALGVTLRARGHEVRILAPAIYEKNASAAGLEFVPVGSPEVFEQFMSQHRLWHPTFGYLALARGIADAIAPTFAAVVGHQAPGRTVLVHSWMFLGARIARDALGIPAVTMHPYPMIFRSRLAPPKIPPLPLRGGSPARNDFWYGAIDLLMDRLLARPINQFRAGLGLPPVKRIMQDWIHSPDRAIGLFPEWFAPPQDDWPKQAALTGFPLYDAGVSEALSADLLRFLEEGDRPVVFTSGTALRNAGAFFQAAVDICRASNRRGLLISPHGAHLPKNLPAFVRRESYAPFSLLLPRCAALVHHGGIGTIAQALAAGTPQIAVPVVFDHADNSARMERLGVGVAIAPGKFNVRTGAAAIERVLGDRYAAACDRVRSLFVGAHPLQQTADLVEQASADSSGVSVRTDRFSAPKEQRR